MFEGGEEKEEFVVSSEEEGDVVEGRAQRGAARGAAKVVCLPKYVVCLFC